MGGYISITNCIAMNEIDIEEINKYWNQNRNWNFYFHGFQRKLKNGEIRVEKKSNRRYFDRNL